MESDQLKSNLKDVQEQSRKLIKQEKDVFVPTITFHKAIDLLNQFRIVIIRGPPVSGKTAIGHALLRHFVDRSFAPLVLQRCTEWRHLVGGDKKQIVLLDSLVGEARVQKHLYLEWETTFSSMGQFIRNNKTCLVVITLNTHIIAELVRMSQVKSFFEDTPYVDLTTHALTIQERETILQKHLACHRPQQGNKDLPQNVIAFARCCKEEVPRNSSFAFIKFFVSVLRDPVNWKDLVPLFVLAMSASDDPTARTEKTETRLKAFGFSLQKVDMKGISQRADLLKGSLLRADKTRFTSGTLVEALAFALHEVGSVDLMLNACAVDFLVKHVQIGRIQASSRSVVIDASSKHYSTLLGRVCREILNGNVIQMSQHSVLQNERFLADLDVFLRKQNCLKQFLTATDPLFDMPLLYWSSWVSSGVLTQWCLERANLAKNGRTLRRTFFAACLQGEKVNSPRVLSMFNCLCQNKTVLEDPVSDVTLPLPPSKHRLSEELRAKCEEILKGKKFLYCRLTKDPVEKNALQQKKVLPTICENSPLNGEIRRDDFTEEEDLGLWVENLSRTSSISSTVYTRSNNLASVKDVYLQPGISIPTSIVELMIEKTEDKVVIIPKCCRWYTIFRLVSMINVMEVNADDYTLLHTAAFNGEIDVVKFLVENGACLTSRTKKGNTPLTKAIEQSQVDVARYLLEQGKVSSSQPSRDFAVDRSRRDSTAGRRGRDITWMLGARDIRDILHDTVRRKHAQMLSLLLSHGASLLGNVHDRQNLLDLSLSIKNNQEVVNLLTQQVWN